MNTEVPEFKKNLVCYHKNCSDGLTAALCLYVLFKEINELDNTEFLAVNYDDYIPSMRDRDVFIVDFSFKPQMFFQACSSAKSVRVFDHHISARKDYEKFINDEDNRKMYNFHQQDNSNSDVLELFFNLDKGNGYIKFDNKKSGAGLAFDYVKNQITHHVNNLFSSNKNTGLDFKEVLTQSQLGRLETVVRHIEDRDLWNFYYQDTRAYYELINSVPPTLEEVYKLIINTTEEEFQEKLSVAKIRVKMREELAEQYASKHEVLIFHGLETAFTNCPANFASEVGSILAEKYPAAFMYSLNSEKVFCSLRSNKKFGVDVSLLAKNYEGGGHANAAGFVCMPDTIFAILKTGKAFMKIKQEAKQN